MGIMTVKQMPLLVTPAIHGTSVRLRLQSDNGLFPPQIPFQGRVRMICVGFSIPASKITLGAEVMLTRHAMRGFELVDKCPRGPSLSFFRTLKTLPDTFLGVSSNPEQSLIGFGVSHDGGCSSLHCQYHGTLSFLRCFMKSPERRRTVVNDGISLVMSSIGLLL
jgi:hypothetical protein